MPLYGALRTRFWVVFFKNDSLKNAIMGLFRTVDVTLTERIPILWSNKKKGSKINHAGITITLNQNFVNAFLRDQSLVQVEKAFQIKHPFGKLTVVQHVQLLNGPFKHCFCFLYFCKKSSERILLVTKS